MRSLRLVVSPVVALAALGAMGSLGCAQLVGLDRFTDAPAGGAGGGGEGAGQQGGGGQGAGQQGGGGQGGGGAASCEEGMSEACFESDPGLIGVGECVAGLATCTGGVLGTCEGQVLPGVEDCYDPGDEDCDGVACSDVVWVRQFTATDSAYAFWLDVAPDGSILIAGQFNGELNLGDTPATLLTASATTSFAAVFEATGEHRWSRAFPIQAGLTMGPDGTLLGSGTFSGTVDLDGLVLTSAGGDDFVTFQVDANGAITSAQQYGGAGDDSGAAYLMANGDSLLFGSTTGPLDFGGAVGVLGPTIEASGQFVVRVSGGVATWGHFYEYDYPYGEEPFVFPYVAGDEVLLAISYQHYLPSVGCGFYSGNTRNLAVMKLDATGATSWTSCANGAVDLRGLAADASGNATVLLNLDDPTVLDPAAGPTIQVEQAGGVGADADILLWRLGPTGSTAWAKVLGDGQEQGLDEGPPFGVATDASGRVLLGSTFYGSVDFGGGLTVTSEGDSDALLASIEADGSVRWAKALGGAGPFQTFFALDSDPATSSLVGLVASGGTIDFGDGNVYTPASGAGIDCFLVKWQP